MYCIRCGAQVMQGAAFCQSCGTRVSAVGDATPPRADEGSHAAAAGRVDPSWSSSPQQCPQCGLLVPRGTRLCDCGYNFVEHRAAGREPSYAGFWWRVLASIIDGVIVQVASVFVVIPIAFSVGASMAGTSTAEEIRLAGQAIGFLIGLLMQWLYFTISESGPWQATLGKKMLGLTVTDEGGQRIGFARANGRYWGKLVSALILGLGFLMAGFTERKQALHDMIAGTLVVKGSPDIVAEPTGMGT